MLRVLTPISLYSSPPSLPFFPISEPASQQGSQHTTSSSPGPECLPGPVLDLKDSNPLVGRLITFRVSNPHERESGRDGRRWELP
ncbi:hypothetical protein E2C01_096165 [Portunus trituberculatus]|uniref:Uncharacterized protein n=1 Tax=Portunus trituberculatus TaxID=210409 RepID=A0A5B7K2C1_PORTR|nr:hypothetical protein [Portunus trituberculatus]